MRATAARVWAGQQQTCARDATPALQTWPQLQCFLQTEQTGRWRGLGRLVNANERLCYLDARLDHGARATPTCNQPGARPGIPVDGHALRGVASCPLGDFLRFALLGQEPVARYSVPQWLKTWVSLKACLNCQTAKLPSCLDCCAHGATKLPKGKDNLSGKV